MKFSKKFEQLLDFVKFTHEFQEVVRVARPPFRDRFENDAEHSYQLAMVAWFLIEQDKLKLNKELCFMYALDKIIPPIQIYLERGKLWHEKKIYFDDVLKNKNPKIAVSSDIDKYWQELLLELRKNKRKLFPLLD